MQIVPKNSAPIMQPTGSSARERAIAAFTEAAAPKQEASHPVQNPTQVSPEEMSAITPSTSGREDNVDTTKVVDPASFEEAQKKALEATKEPEPAKDPLSSQYANLARKEKQLRAKVIAQEQALKAREDAIKAREEALLSKDSEYKSKYIQVDKIKQDPLTTLNELGLTYDELTKFALNGTKSPEELQRDQTFEELRAEIKALRTEQENTKKSFQQQQEDSYKQAVNQITNDVRSLVSGNPEFEAIDKTSSVSDVVELIERTFKEDKILLSVEEAAKQVEDYLVEEAFKVSQISKIQKRLQPASSAAAPAQGKSESNKQPQNVTMKTLTNNISSTGQLSARDRAILAFKGQLK